MVAPTVRPGATRWNSSLILVVTRKCDLRCTYCPTVKDGLPDLTGDDVRRALGLFVDYYGGGDCKIFGGEPALVPDLIRTVVTAAPPNVSVYLSSNGRQLGEDTLALLEEYPKTTLTITLDGPADLHDLHRRLPGGPGDSHAKILEKLPRLLKLPRLVITQTIAPGTADRAAESFRYLLSLGIRKFNLLPGYYVPYKPEQLDALARSFAEIEATIKAEWQAGRFLYLRNLFVRAPTPFYNTGMVIDVDRRIHPSNLILARRFDDLRDESALGTLDNPPTRDLLALAARETGARLERTLAPGILAATNQADGLLTRLCNNLYPAFFAYRQRFRSEVV